MAAPFTTQEILEVIKSLPSAKTPGLDGYSTLFYTQFRDAFPLPFSWNLSLMLSWLHTLLFDRVRKPISLNLQR